MNLYKLLEDLVNITEEYLTLLEEIKKATEQGRDDYDIATEYAESLEFTKEKLENLYTEAKAFVEQIKQENAEHELGSVFEELENTVEVIEAVFEK